MCLINMHFFSEAFITIVESYELSIKVTAHQLMVFTLQSLGLSSSFLVVTIAVNTFGCCLVGARYGSLKPRSSIKYHPVNHVEGGTRYREHQPFIFKC